MPKLELGFFGKGVVYVPPTERLLTPRTETSYDEYIQVGCALRNVEIASAFVACPPRILSVFTRITFQNLPYRIWPFWARHVSARINFENFDGWPARLSIFGSDGCTTWAEPIRDHEVLGPFSSVSIALTARRYHIRNMTIRLSAEQGSPKFSREFKNIPVTYPSKQ
ncbi:MAG: hypothetical protein NUV81_00605 [bacterium]|nr:hypothetical protein [bacterium]